MAETPGSATQPILVPSSPAAPVAPEAMAAQPTSDSPGLPSPSTFFTPRQSASLPASTTQPSAPVNTAPSAPGRVTEPQPDDAGADCEDEESDDDSEYDSEYDSEAETVDSVDRYVDDMAFTCLYQFESAYTPKRAAKRSQRAFLTEVVHYDHCTPKELKAFVVGRGLQDPFPQGLTLKSLYIRTLDKADENPTFRFLDLPPEMRNMIYTELLTWVCPCARHRFCFPQILRTSRQVHKEAADILYAENTVDCSFIARQHVHGVHMDIHRDCIHSACRDSPHETQPEGITKFPTFLSRVWNLKITIDLSYDYLYGWSGRRVCRLIMNMVSSMMDDHCLKNLTVTYLLDLEHEDGEAPPVDDEYSKRILYPLRRLRNISNVTIRGDIPTDLKRGIEAEIRSSEPTVNSMKRYHFLQREVSAYLAMAHCMKSINDEDEDEHYGDETPPGLEKCIEDLQFIVEEENVGCDDTEYQFSEALDNLEEALRSRENPSVLSTAQKYLDATSASRTYAAERGYAKAP